MPNHSAKLVWSVIHRFNSKNYALELISKSNELAGGFNKGQCWVVFAGEQLPKETVDMYATTGCERVLHIKHNEQGPETERLISEKIASLASEYHPEIILFLSDPWAQTVAPQTAAILKTGLTADCTELRMDDGYLVQTRPAYGSSILAEIVCKDKRPQMATVSYGLFGTKVTVEQREIPVTTEHLRYSEHSRVRLISSKQFDEDMMYLREARTIFAGGLGIAGKSGFLRLEELAKKYRVAVGASRAAVNAGYAHYSLQIGQTGLAVRPELYIAFGISGAVHHLAGMKTAKTVIAVNKDKNAPIFNAADHAIIGDCNEIIEKLLSLYR